jgi:hypothetical protein
MTATRRSDDAGHPGLDAAPADQHADPGERQRAVPPALIPGVSLDGSAEGSRACPESTSSTPRLTDLWL